MGTQPRHVLSTRIASSALLLILFGTAPLSARLQPLDGTGRMPVVSVSIALPIAPGDTVTAILRRYGIAPGEISSLVGAARPYANLRHVEAGRYLTLLFGPHGELAALRYQLGRWREVVIEHSGAGLAARLDDGPVQVEVVAVRATVRTTFERAARAAGIPEPILSRMVDLLSGEINFDSDVVTGDRFRVLFETRKRPNGDALAPGRILAADFVGRKRSAAAFFYAEDQGTPCYVDDDGRPLESAFLRYPVEFTRISSAFAESRFHPILQEHRPHLGVDLAAPAGTPVRSIGAGRVIWADWKGSLGRHVEIDHGNGLTSAYSHLREIDAGLQPGVPVRQGQRIGVVGQSGLATGPHLHFALFEDGQYTNPLSLHRAPPATPIDHVQFEAVRTAMMEQLRTIPGAVYTMPSTAPVALSALAQARRLGAGNLTL